jgi:hypothetical protein
MKKIGGLSGDIGANLKEMGDLVEGDRGQFEGDG